MRDVFIYDHVRTPRGRGASSGAGAVPAGTPVGAGPAGGPSATSVRTPSG